MRRVIATLLFSAGTHYALAEWTEVVRTYNPVAYADFATLQRKGDSATMSVLVDYQKVPFDGDNLPYRSLKMLVEYDCKTAQFRFLELASYSGRMATGKSPYTAHEPGKWQPVLDVGIQKPLWDKVCGNKGEEPIKAR